MKSLAILFSFILIGCSSTPKGEYSRSKIDRPYSLPDDVARSSFGLYAESIEVTKSDSLTEDEDDDDTYGSYLLSFETLFAFTFLGVFGFQLVVKKYFLDYH